MALGILDCLCTYFLVQAALKLRALTITYKNFLQRKWTIRIHIFLFVLMNIFLVLSVAIQFYYFLAKDQTITPSYCQSYAVSNDNGLEYTRLLHRIYRHLTLQGNAVSAQRSAWPQVELCGSSKNWRSDESILRKSAFSLVNHRYDKRI